VLGGETPAERFARAAGAWDCSVTWLALPDAYARQEPPASTSALELSLSVAGDQARYVKYAMSRSEKLESTQCRLAAVFVPCTIRLASEDGALDETFDAELELSSENTLLDVTLGAYDFTGTHAVTFVDGIERDQVELSLAFTPALELARVDGALIESGKRSGADPLLTTALIACTRL